jgi:hypothetical protein
MGIGTSATCEKCEEEEETSEHFLLKCPFYAQERLQKLGNTFLDAEDIRRTKIANIRNFILGTKRLTTTEPQLEYTASQYNQPVEIH